MLKSLRVKGFTLIELLIVIAIILILIAIALPNFLEAQTRAKVVKSRGSMRSIELAMHSLNLDMGSIHPDFNDIGHPDQVVRDMVHRIRARGNCSSPDRVCDCQCPFFSMDMIRTLVFKLSNPQNHYCPGIHCPLTTPVSYMAEAETIDPFGAGIFPHGYDSYPGGTGGFVMSYGAIFGIGPDMIAGHWRRGLGENVDVNGDGVTDALPYSPTNGTKSLGEFWRVVAFDTNIAKSHYPVLLW
jgi:prepilin-type N-terminal cleavage/methylation domain-containing protein